MAWKVWEPDPIPTVAIVATRENVLIGRRCAALGERLEVPEDLAAGHVHQGTARLAAEARPGPAFAAALDAARRDHPDPHPTPVPAPEPEPTIAVVALAEGVYLAGRTLAAGEEFAAPVGAAARAVHEGLVRLAGVPGPAYVRAAAAHRRAQQERENLARLC